MAAGVVIQISSSLMVHASASALNQNDNYEICNTRSARVAVTHTDRVALLLCSQKVAFLVLWHQAWRWDLPAGLSQRTNTWVLVTTGGDILILHRFQCFFPPVDLPFSSTNKDTPMKRSHTHICDKDQTSAPCSTIDTIHPLMSLIISGCIQSVSPVIPLQAWVCWFQRELFLRAVCMRCMWLYTGRTAWGNFVPSACVCLWFPYSLITPVCRCLSGGFHSMTASSGTLIRWNLDQVEPSSLFEVVPLAEVRFHHALPINVPQLEAIISVVTYYLFTIIICAVIQIIS